MPGLLQWRKRKGLTQVDAASLLGVSQPYLSLLEKGARPVTAKLRNRLQSSSPKTPHHSPDDRLRSQLSTLGYPGFSHFPKTRSRVQPSALLLSVLSQTDADARIVESLPWLIANFESHFDYPSLIRQAKLHNLQNRLGFLLELAPVKTPAALSAVQDLERARLLAEDTLCWDSMPPATRQWMRTNRSPLAAHWNILTRLSSHQSPHAA
ncbi:MAG: helix-turn-helix transcriptional regulator [Bryobacter sp.]|nr:helix-turn-helix transcriptional regulator [Bryobacter sp.]